MEIRFHLNVQPGALSRQPDPQADPKGNARTTGSDPRDSGSFEEFAEELAMALVAELLKGNPLLQQLLGGGERNGDESSVRESEAAGPGRGRRGEPHSALKEALFAYLEQMLDDSKDRPNVRGQPGSKGARESNWPDSASQFLRGSGTNLLNNAIAPTQDGGGQLQNSSVLAPVASLMDKHEHAFGKPNPAGATPPFAAPGRPSATAPAEPVGLSQVPGGDASPAKSAPPKVASSHAEGNFAFTKIQEGGVGGSSGIEFPKASANPTVVNEPIRVKKGEVFDGEGKTFTAGSELGDGGQREDQLPLFILEDGASLKNVVLGDNGADGVHVHGDAKLDNVHWTNVGEDALTVKPNQEGKKVNVEITNGSAQGANDKIFQLNADANLTIDNFKAKDFGSFLRTNGGQQGDWNINLKNISAEDGKYKFVNSDAEEVKVSADNIRLQNVHEHFRLSKSSTLNLGREE